MRNRFEAREPSSGPGRDRSVDRPTAESATTREAFGRPGAAPVWAPGSKQGIGTSADAASPLWFTLAQGVITELYYPRVDVPNTRDLQFLVLLPGGEVVEERRDTEATVERVPLALAHRVTAADWRERFRVEKRVVTDPQRPSLALLAARPGQGGGRCAALRPARPARGGPGSGNSARALRWRGRSIAVAWRRDTYLALAASLPFARPSCGFVGVSDGWTDLQRRGTMTWGFEAALDGNVAVLAERKGSAAAGAPSPPPG
jgi:glucoamylase